MTGRILHSAFFLLHVAFAFALNAHANVTLPSLFADGMVLQRDQPAPVWGKAAPGEKITVAFAGQTATAIADAGGRWLATLAPMPASAQPRDMEIFPDAADSDQSKIPNPKSKITISNVLVGDVWLASGQSNMFFQLRQTANAAADIAASANPLIRYFDVPRTVAGEPQFTTKSKWVDCTPRTAPAFTAVGYYFARQLQRDLNIPVAIIHSSWGGTNAEAWTPCDVLASSPATATIITQWDETMRDFPRLKAGFEADKKRLVAEWKIACEKAAAEGRMPPAEPRLRTGPGTQYQPAGLYNAMITPLAPFALSGVIWYQGEGNAPRATQYRTLFPAMIKSWRALWKRDDLPFLFVQLPNLARQPEPSKSGWAEIREAQLRTLALPRTAMAVTIDVGDPKDLHPKNKLPVGQRLAYAAEALAGQRPPADSICPYPTKHHTKGNEIRVTLTPSSVTLKTRDGQPPRGFVIAGPDKKFVPAQARIEGNALVMWSDAVSAPAAARYAWADNPDCNIVSAAGLPVSPFRTDDWPTAATEAQAGSSPDSAPAPQTPSALQPFSPSALPLFSPSALPPLTLDEKLNLLAGVDAFFLRGVERLGIPATRMGDGPVGVRNWGPSTLYPATILLAATWDENLAARFGAALARDSLARDMRISLAPGVNIYRSPLNGRNYEYMGEDPLLAGRMAAASIKAVQAQGVAATIKHFATNNSETRRSFISNEIDERTLREIYLPAFEMAVRDGKVWCVMDAYNLLNGAYCTANDWLNNKLLKGEWGFQGVVMSDWNATHDTLGAALGGLDLEMPAPTYFTPEKLKPLVESGKIPMPVIDDKVARILRLIAAHPTTPNNGAIPLDDPAGAATALEIARSGITLLKNEKNLLPLDSSKIKTIAVLGPNASRVVTGLGSGNVTPFHSTSVVAGLRAALGDASVIEIPWSEPLDYLGQTPGAQNLKLEIFAGRKKTKPVSTAAVGAIDFTWERKTPSANIKAADQPLLRWTAQIKPAQSGGTQFVIDARDINVRVWLDGKLCWDSVRETTGSFVQNLAAGKTHDLKIEGEQRKKNVSFTLKAGWGPARPLISAGNLDALRNADAALVCVGFNVITGEGEGYDRTYALPGRQEELIRAAASANPRTIVALNAGGSVATENWINNVPAFLHTFYGGQEGGAALADILLGKTNPSGRLPFSYEKRWEDCAAYANYATDYTDDSVKKITYAEGVFIGYRWFDAKKIEPLFPFGHGLGYTTFAYRNLRASVQPDEVVVSVDVQNTGDREGSEVVQLYVAPKNPAVPRPVRELKSFAKVRLAPNETRTVTFALDRRAFSYFHPERKAWTVDACAFDIEAGASSRDIRQTFTLAETPWTNETQPMRKTPAASAPSAPSAAETPPAKRALPADVLLDEDFAADTIGAIPSGAISVSPSKPDDTLAVSVVAQPASASGKAVRIFDNAPKGATLDYNIADSAAAQKTALKISFDLVWQGAPAGAARNSLNFGVGAFGGPRDNLTANARRLFSGFFYNDGKARFDAGATAKGREFSIAPAGSLQKFVIYLNDFETRTLTVSAPDGAPLALAPNTMTVYQNGKQICVLPVEKFAGKESQMGRMGFSTVSAATGLDFLIAGLCVSTLEK